MIRNILFNDKAHFTPKKTRNSHLWDRDNPRGTVERINQYLFAVNMWCGVIGEQLIGPYNISQLLTGDIYTDLQNDVPAYLENVRLQTQRHMHYQRDEAPPHFGQVVRQHLNHKFPNRWFGRGGAQNLPPRSPDLKPLD